MFRRFLAMFCCICIAFCCGTSTSAASSIEVLGPPQVKLSSLTNEECIAYLESVGVHYPEAFEGLDLDIRGFIEELEKNPDMQWTMFNSPTTQHYYNGIRRAVSEYYGDNYINYAIQSGAYASGLNYSVLSSWNASTMPHYNCYAYALELTDRFYEPGFFYGKKLSFAAKVDSLSQLTVGDLINGWGYCAKEHSSLPSSSGWNNVIAVRYGESIKAGALPDFHFARLINPQWKHKPGGSAILTFKSSPTNGVNWYNEYYDGTFVTEYDTIYSGTIKYITYNQKHDHETYTSNNYHDGNWHFYEFTTSCSKCGSTGTYWKRMPCSGNPCVSINSVTPPPVES